MADDERLRIVIEALNAAKGELDALQKDLEGIGQKAKPANTGITGLWSALKAAGVVAGAVKFAKVTYELGVLGAEAQRAEASFARMAGGTYEAALMLETLREASLGTKSETELMASATNLMALGFGNSAEDLANITRNVEMLGSRFGGTMQIFQLMMSNNSLMRIDSFGIGVAEATKRIDEFKATGMDADEAFDTAILELMNEKVEMLGGTMQDSVTSVQQSKAAWQDFRVELGKLFSGTIGQGSGVMGGVLREMADNLGMLNDALARVDESPLLKLVQLVNIGLGGWSPGLSKDLGKAALELEAIAKGTKAASQGFSDVGASGPQAAEAIAKVTDGSFDLFWRMRDVEAQSLGLADVTYDSAAAWRDYSAAVNGSTDYLSQYQEQQEQAAAAAAAAAEEFKLISWATKQTFGAEWDASADTIEQLKQKAADLQAAIAATDDEAEMSNLRGELAGVRADIELVIGSMKEMQAQFVLGLLESQLAASDMSEGVKAQILTAYAESLGLIDETAAATSRAVTAILDDVTLTADEKIAALIALASDMGTAVETAALAASGGLLDIIAHAEDAAAALRNIGLSAEAAQIMLDRMHGKTIELEVNWIERNRPTTPDGAYITGRNEIGWNAGGGDYIVSQPTVFGAGETGAERAIFIPQGEPGFDAPNAAMAALAYGGAALGTGAAGSTWNGDIVIQGAGDPQATAGAVMRELQRRGIVPVGGVR